MNNPNIELNHFIKNKIKSDLDNGKIKDNKIIVRFPPEPNGYLHLGHVKSIILNSTLAEEFNGELNLRFDDTNPEKETEEYVEAIKKDSFWLSDKFTNIFWASNYFDKIYTCAEHLIKKGLAYVDDSDADTIKYLRGDFNTTGKNSMYINRNIEENLLLFRNMKLGVYNNGAKVLRARIDIKSPNINMRDPVIYRIKHVTHHNTGDKWCIYPMYDFAHPLCDGFEGITHSICTMEFEDHRPLYNWFVDKCKDLLISTPEQIEFARLEMEGVLLSKRKLHTLVTENKVTGWNDPAMPTVAGLRNRGFTPDILKDFIMRSGFSKANSVIEKHVLDECVRDKLSPITPRTMAIINPVELIITNFKELNLENEFKILNLPNHPKNENLGHRNIHLTSHLWVERDDIRSIAEPDFWRIYPGNWVRLKHGYNIFIKEVLVDESNVPIKVIAELDINSKNMKLAKHKAKVALHWLSNMDAINFDCCFYNTLCDNEGNYNENCINKKIIKVENTLSNIYRCHFEFERNGYFYINENTAHCLALLKNNK